MDSYQQAEELKTAISELAKPGAEHAAAVARIKSASAALLIAKMENIMGTGEQHIKWAHDLTDGFVPTYLEDLRQNIYKGAFVDDDAWSGVVARSTSAISSHVASTLFRMTEKTIDARKRDRQDLKVERK